MRRIPLLVVVMLIVARSGFAQGARGPLFSAGVDTPAADVAAAITFNVFINSNGVENVHVGWSFAAAKNFSEVFGITAEAGVAHQTVRSARTRRVEDALVYGVGIGPRVSTPFLHVGGGEPLDFRVFGQLLVGAAISDLSSGGVAIHPGAGVDIATRSGLVVRVLGSDVFVPRRPEVGGPRLLVGLVFGIGSTNP